jgi:ATP-binding cassette, subfamily B, bacterial
MMTGPALFGLRLDDSVTRQKIKPDTIRRVLPYARPYRWALALFVLVSALDAVITVANPLLLRTIIDNGILPRHLAVVVWISVTMAGLALLDALAVYVQTWYSARIGQGLILDLRTKVFKHLQRQPLAFFTRAQTGSLVSRLNTDIVGAQQAVTTLLSQTVSTVLTLALLTGAMFYLSWQISVIAILVVPLFVLAGRLVGRRLQRLAREGMQLDAVLGSMLNERFNVAGAMLTKLYGRPAEESRLFTARAGRVRDVAVLTTVYGRVLFIVLTLFTTLVTAAVYGFGGWLSIDSNFKIGTLVAMVALLVRMYAPITQLTSLQVNVQTALVSFDRVFEVLDLKPAVEERPGATAIPRGDLAEGNGTGQTGPGTAPAVEFEEVRFRYPSASEVSLASLESIALPMPERPGETWILDGVSFRAAGGQMTALVGPSGAGKTTITHLVPRLYDPGSGTVRIGGADIRDVTLESLRDTVGVVPQEAHLFHDTIRSNLLYARPDATEPELIEACAAARIWEMIEGLPNGLDTVAGDRGYRLSGGEKQRIALARLLLKSPSVVVLDEATAHLDSESEAAIQQALRTALAGRTSLVIAHRLSTIREADQILVVSAGRIAERGTHDELLLAGGTYSELYRTQFAPQAGLVRSTAGEVA